SAVGSFCQRGESISASRRAASRRETTIGGGRPPLDGAVMAYVLHLWTAAIRRPKEKRTARPARRPLWWGYRSAPRARLQEAAAAGFRACRGAARGPAGPVGPAGPGAGPATARAARPRAGRGTPTSPNCAARTARSGDWVANR